MKKTLTIILLAIFSVFAVTGCTVSSTINYDGRYWYKDSTASSNIYEQIEYTVKVVSKTESNSIEIKNNEVSLVVDEGTFVATLTKDGENYNYQTNLNLKGNYILGEQTMPVNDDVASKVVFKINNFKPIYSEKKSNSTTTLLTSNSAYSFVNFSYDYSINYGEKNAETVYNSKINGEKTETTTVKNTFKNYSDNAYIDNELLFFMPRAFKIKDKESFSLAFTTIDVLTQKVHDMNYATLSQQNSTLDIKTFNFTYDNVINGEKVEYAENKIQVVKVLLSINDTFSGSTIELYYAIDHQTDRHRLIKAYTPLNDEMGYLEYTIKSAVIDTNI